MDLAIEIPPSAPTPCSPELIGSLVEMVNHAAEWPADEGVVKTPEGEDNWEVSIEDNRIWVNRIGGERFLLYLRNAERARSLPRAPLEPGDISHAWRLQEDHRAATVAPYFLEGCIYVEALTEKETQNAAAAFNESAGRLGLYHVHVVGHETVADPLFEGMHTVAPIEDKPVLISPSGYVVVIDAELNDAREAVNAKGAHLYRLATCVH